MRWLLLVAFGLLQHPVLSQSHPQLILPTSNTREALFGIDLAFWGDQLLIGAPGDSDQAALSGAVEAYDLVGGNWTRVQSIRPTTPVAGDALGRLIEVGGDELFVFSGRGVFVFARDDDAWAERQLITIPNGQRIVSLLADEQRLIIGVRHYPTIGFGEGTIYIYTKPEDDLGPNRWVLRRALQANPGVGDDFGRDVCIAGSEIFVAAPRDPVVGDHSGSVYVFIYEDGDWRQSQKLLPAVPTAAAQFGSAIACDKSRLVIHAGSQGRTFDYRRGANGDWLESRTVAVAEEFRGSDVHLLDGTLYISGGEYLNATQTSWINPLLALEDREDGWTITHTIRTPHPIEDWERDEGEFGKSVAATSEYLAVGSPYRDEVGRDEMGEVHVFDRVSMVSSSDQPTIPSRTVDFSAFPTLLRAGDSVRIIHAGQDLLRLTLFDTMGRAVRTFEASADGRVAVGQLKPGVYFLRGCSPGSGCSTEALVLTR